MAGVVVPSRARREKPHGGFPDTGRPGAAVRLKMTFLSSPPRVIQGGMGVAVSNWRLANAVARTGNLGVVSGTMIDTVLTRRLQDGDPGGHMRRAIAAFPIPEVGDEILRRYFIEGGRAPHTPYKMLPMYKQHVSAARQRVTVLANFVEVWLAKEGHQSPIGINLLAKVQIPNLPSLYGAMLADVDVVIMGAGIPREIPGALDALAGHKTARVRFDISGLASDQAEYLAFDPALIATPAMMSTPLHRPAFIPVVSAATLAITLARKSNGRVDGFIVEGPTAGGHNAPPRGALQLNASGEPIYGERDVVDLEKMRELDLPFWLAGGTGSPDGLRAALAVGAAGIQVGTLFAYCEESGLDPALKARVLMNVLANTATLRTDPRASPTGYPFKIVELPGDFDKSSSRDRICDLGYLREAVRTSEGRTVYRCASEPVDAFVAKGGVASDTEGRRCLCNGLLASVGQPQRRAAENERETTLVTSGDDLLSMGGFVSRHPVYTAADVIACLRA